MSEKFEIKYENSESLFCGQSNNFKNVLHIEGRNNKVIIYQRDRGGMPGDVYHGQTEEFDLPNCVKIEKIVVFIELYRDEFQELLDGYTEKWNGQNDIGSFDSEKAMALKRNLDSDDSFQFEYVYEDADEFVHTGFGTMADFVAENPKPADGNFEKLADEILDGNGSDTYCDFRVKELAEYLEAEAEEIWGE